MSEDARHIEYIDLIVKDLSRELSEQERSKLDAWLGSDKDNQSIYDEYKRIWLELDKVEGKTSSDVDFEWRRLERAISEEDSAPAARPNVFLRIAASVVLFIALSIIVFFVLNQNQTEEVVAQQAIEEISLPEGTKVSLNRQTTLEYKTKFDGETREVKLDGEAFFEVVRDTLRPFIVQTGDLFVEVLGTAFNVKAYQGDDLVEVTVESGKVAVYRMEDKGNMVILVRGQKAVFRKEVEELTRMDNEDLNFKSWKTRHIIFEDTPMFEVVKIVNEIYGSDIRLESDQLLNCPVTTEFNGQTIETILKVLSSTLDLEVTKEAGQIIISGEGC